jgi:hypothetical protein
MSFNTDLRGTWAHFFIKAVSYMITSIPKSEWCYAIGKHLYKVECTYLCFFFGRVRVQGTQIFYSAQKHSTDRITESSSCIWPTTSRTGHNKLLWVVFLHELIGWDPKDLLAWWAQQWATPLISLRMWYIEECNGRVRFWNWKAYLLISHIITGSFAPNAATTLAKLQ